jgi:hypothetical protein
MALKPYSHKVLNSYVLLCFIDKHELTIKRMEASVYRNLQRLPLFGETSTACIRGLMTLLWEVLIYTVLLLVLSSGVKTEP